jgi:hypothetical protein
MEILDARETKACLPYPELADSIREVMEGMREGRWRPDPSRARRSISWEDATQLEDALLWSNNPGGTIVLKSVGHALWDLAARAAFGFRTPKSRR